MERRHYPNFDWLRLFLALEVLVLHVHGVNTGWREMLPLPIPPVPTFLAISGFLVLKSLENSDGIGHFWSKRAWRILPAFIAVLIFTQFLHGWEGVLASLRAYYTVGIDLGNTPNSSLWSLSAEEIAYALMAVLFARGFYKRPNLVLWAGLGYTFVLLGYAYIFDDTGHLWSTLPAAFFIGSYCYIAGVEKLPSWWGWATWSSLIALLLWKTPDVEAMRLAMVVPIAAFGAILIGVGKPIPIKLPFDISYGIYIYHLPILVFLRREYRLDGIELWAWGVGLTLLVSLISYFAIERPALRRKHGRLTGRARSPVVEAA